ncbi:MAG TPA: glycosyltransferase family 2 protein, partial [Trueperaceae bacterium]|nr:glycosyltransferase family 2 protein [Trueperaceae bacterium]
MYEVIRILGLIAQILFLVYFSILQLSFAYSGLIAVQYLRRMLRQGGKQTLEYQLRHNFVIPISILVPAYNEEATIVTSLHSFLSLHYPDFEIVAINDGSSDKTIDIIIEEFDLIPTTHYGRSFTKTAKVVEVYRSLRYPNLTVIDKENGGKADALNVGLAYARKSIFTAVDADSLLDADALLRVTRRFKEDDDMVAIGGTIRVLNNATLEAGKVTALANPKKWIERFQVIEYIRAFYIGRASLSHFNMQLIISGAFGIFKRDPVIEVGGYRSDTVGEDMELV